MSACKAENPRPFRAHRFDSETQGVALANMRAGFCSAAIKVDKYFPAPEINS